MKIPSPSTMSTPRERGRSPSGIIVGRSRWRLPRGAGKQLVALDRGCHAQHADPCSASTWSRFRDASGTRPNCDFDARRCWKTGWSASTNTTAAGPRGLPWSGRMQSDCRSRSVRQRLAWESRSYERTRGRVPSSARSGLAHPRELPVRHCGVRPASTVDVSTMAAVLQDGPLRALRKHSLPGSIGRYADASSAENLAVDARTRGR